MWESDGYYQRGDGVVREGTTRRRRGRRAPLRESSSCARDYVRTVQFDGGRRRHSSQAPNRRPTLGRPGRTRGPQYNRSAHPLIHPHNMDSLPYHHCHHHRLHLNSAQDNLQSSESAHGDRAADGGGRKRTFLRRIRILFAVLQVSAEVCVIWLFTVRRRDGRTATRAAPSLRCVSGASSPGGAQLVEPSQSAV